MTHPRCTCTALDQACPACQAYGATQRPTAHRQVAPGTAGVRTREDTLADALRQEAREMQGFLGYARRYGPTGVEAQRFLARQRASVRRQRQQAQAHETTQLTLLSPRHVQTAAQILCPHCGQWWRITSIPFKTPCCATVLLVEE
jgi:hypothetical protein